MFDEPIFGKQGFQVRGNVEELLGSLVGKRDLLAIEWDGVPVGSVIYEDCLERLGFPTLDPRDPAIGQSVRKALEIYEAARARFEAGSVGAVFLSRWGGLPHGIWLRLAFYFGVPVFYLWKRNPDRYVELFPDQPFYPYFSRFRHLFDALPPAERPGFRRQAGVLLSDRLAGKPDTSMPYLFQSGTSGFTGYGARSQGPLLLSSKKPKILVLLSCFHDSPHTYGQFLFPDFWEWICFLLKTAEKTPFEWYVKPHPTGLPRNAEVLRHLKAKFPSANFLAGSASNRQLVDEGVRVVFTPFGAAGHEFAYMGVPAIHGGYHPHVAYGFNLRPGSQEELKEMVLTADRQPVQINRDEVEEFAYMNYFYSPAYVELPENIARAEQALSGRFGEAVVL